MLSLHQPSRLLGAAWKAKRWRLCDSSRSSVFDLVSVSWSIMVWIAWQWRRAVFSSSCGSSMVAPNSHLRSWNCLITAVSPLGIERPPSSPSSRTAPYPPDHPPGGGMYLEDRRPRSHRQARRSHHRHSPDTREAEAGLGTSWRTALDLAITR